MSVQETENEIVEEFSFFTDWMEKYEYLIDLGKNLPLIDESNKTESNLINGCQSRVWLSVEYKNGKLHFTADSDAIITKGLISLLIRVYSDRTPKEINSSDFSFIDKIGLKENLSPTRANGLVSMIKKIKSYALVYEIKEKELQK
ncbi:MAG: SufE family protein [Bacteroidales bacterium]